MSISSTVRRNAQTLKCYILAKLFPEKYIVYRASLRIKKGEPVHNNWGDDINPVIIELLSGKKALFLPNSILSRNFPIKNYLVVGSSLTFYPLDKTHVWGAGIINENKIENITTKPFRVSAVRGPLTRNALIEKDIECPLVYGDPALLLPLLYYPCVHRENKIGIIPHFIDVHEKSVEKLLTYKHTKLINVRGYKEWKEFIDEICSCNFIVSSSLHGLIIAEAYNIPCIWAEFGTYIDGWEFKFHDFFESIGKKEIRQTIINENTSMEDLKKQSESWRPGKIDLKNLVKSCPFISSEIAANILKKIDEQNK